MRVSRTVSRTTALLALLPLAACTGGGGGDPRTAGPRKASVSPAVADPTAVGSLPVPTALPTGNLSPATQTVRYAATAAREAGTVRFTFEQAFSNPDGRVGRLRGSGVADLLRYRSRLVADFRGAFSTPPPTPEMTIVMSHGDWWVEIPEDRRAAVGKEWAHAPLDTVGYGAGPVWPMTYFLRFLTVAEDAREVRPNVYAASIPVEAAARVTDASLARGTLETLREATGGAPLPVEAELDGEGRPVRVTVSFRDEETKRRITTTLLLTAYGTPAEVELPDPARTRSYDATVDAMKYAGIV